jgi:hypothetical protein
VAGGRFFLGGAEGQFVNLSIGHFIDLPAIDELTN